MARVTTEAVIQHHGQALTSGNLDEVLENYTEDSVLFTHRDVQGAGKNQSGLCSDNEDAPV